MKRFNANDFLNALIDDVASSERAGKKFEADAAILGPLLLSVVVSTFVCEISGEGLELPKA